MPVLAARFSPYRSGGGQRGIARGYAGLGYNQRSCRLKSGIVKLFYRAVLVPGAHKRLALVPERGRLGRFRGRMSVGVQRQNPRLG